MSEELPKLLSDIAQMKQAPDADLPFLINLETTILGYIKSKADNAISGGPPGGGMPNPLGGPPPQPGMPGAPPGPGGQVLGGIGASLPGQGTPPGVPGVMQGPGMPNADELRRVLQQATTSHRLQRIADMVAPPNMGASPVGIA